MPVAKRYITTAWSTLFAGHEAVFASPQLELPSLLSEGKTTSRNVKCTTITLLVYQSRGEFHFVGHVANVYFFIQVYC